MFGKSKEIHEGVKSMVAVEKKVSNNLQTCLHADVHTYTVS